jgi:hypothetical protein
MTDENVVCSQVVALIRALANKIIMYTLQMCSQS